MLSPSALSCRSSGGLPRDARPGGRRIRSEYVWFVISTVTWRLETNFLMFWVSGSENGPGPKWSSAVGSPLAPGPPQNVP
jgi:hypothetical protein